MSYGKKKITINIVMEITGKIIHSRSRFLLTRVACMLEPIPSDLGHEAVHTLPRDILSMLHRPTRDLRKDKWFG